MRVQAQRDFACWIVSLAMLALTALGCGTSSSEDGAECTPGVADFASNQVGNGNEGDFCVLDRDCDRGLTCDNDTVGAVMPCHCIPETGGTGGTGGSGPSDCSGVTPGNGQFGAACRNDGDCLDGLPCCTSTDVSSACGVEVDLCQCI